MVLGEIVIIHQCEKDQFMILKTQAIKAFLTHRAHADLASMYHIGMECQVNVGQDGGDRIEGEYKGRNWQAWTDGISTWKSFRIPYKAATEPEYEDTEIKFDLDVHAEGIGMTGWDWQRKQSKWVAYDFDSMMNHAEGLTHNELMVVQEAACGIEWVTVRKSTSGKGLHLYVELPNVHTANHTEHAALARAILGTMSAIAGCDFSSKIDACGGNMWIWHRKMKGTDGLTIIKKGIVLNEIPPNWRDHIKVINGSRRKNLPQGISEPSLFEELTGQRPYIQLDDEHKRLIEYLRETDAMWWWDNDHHMLVTHTMYLKQAHADLQLKGYFDTISAGTNVHEQNVFLFPMRKGAWGARRYTQGVAEHESWEQDGSGWTRCFFNKEPDFPTSCRASGGLEDPSGGYVFRDAHTATKAAQLLGVTMQIGVAQNSRKTKMKQHKDGRLIIEIEKDAMDHAEEMKGWLPKKDSWVRVYNAQLPSPAEPDVGNYDDLVRHQVTATGDDCGWVLSSENAWRNEPLHHIKTALGSMGFNTKDITNIIGSSVFKAWKLVNKPFQPEYPGCREWNRNAAQFRFIPTANTENLKYDTWRKILNHCGKGLDDVVKVHPWCKANGLMNGGDYLKCWIASMLQEPLQPLPYLALYGPQSSGKTILHEALALLLTSGCKRADAALESQQGFNGELEGAILCVVEETNLGSNKTAYNRIKDWVTSRELMVHPKNQTPYHIPNSTHWIQCLPSYTWIMTSNGPKRLLELIDRQSNLAVNNDFNRTQGFFCTGTKEVFTITTADGYELDCTSNELIRCRAFGIEYWKEASELKPIDRLVLNDHNDLHWDGHGQFDQGYALGYLFGDGTLSDREDHKIYVYEKSRSALDTLRSALPRCSEVLREDKGIVLSGTSLNDLCKTYGIIDKTITDNIEQASSDFIEGFLAGLFDTDGSVIPSRYVLVYYQSDIDILKAVQRMLLRFGIKSHLSLARPKGKHKAAYSLSIRNKQNITRFHDRIDLSIDYKTRDIKRLLYSWTRKPVDVDFTSQFKRIESTGNMDVFDCTVPDTHRYSANGFIVHNCSNNHNYCPVFRGDTRVTLCFVPPLDPLESIPRKKLIPMLEKEAPDFLADILKMEIPESTDRLNVPVLETADKTAVQDNNQTMLEQFIDEKCDQVNGHLIKFSEFHERFQQWLPTDEIAHWGRITMGRALPPQFLKGRIRKDAQHYIGNVAWRNDNKKPDGRFVILNDYLEKLND